jgi:hypothetical protein
MISCDINNRFVLNENFYLKIIKLRLKDFEFLIYYLLIKNQAPTPLYCNFTASIILTNRRCTGVFISMDFDPYPSIIKHIYKNPS